MTLAAIQSPISRRKPAQRLRCEGEEKARPVYEKALRPFHHLRAFSELERLTGVEPAYAAWEAAVLPMNYSRI